MFGEILRNLVTQTGKTQKEVAAEIGLSQQRFNYYATSKREPDIDTLKKMSIYFGVSVDYLTGNTDGTELDMQEYPFLIKYRSIESRGKEIVDQLLDKLYAEQKENAPTAYSDERIEAILQNKPELTELANQIRMLDGEQTLKAIDYIQYLLSQQDKS